MTNAELASTAQALVAGGKGILAADETPGTLTRRLDALKIESTPDSRRAYREMFFTTPGIAEFISGVILQDETIRQRNSKGTALADVLAQQGIIPGIKSTTAQNRSPARPGKTLRKDSTGCVSA
jgi:fructose-bisphosphate aldolase, class I